MSLDQSRTPLVTPKAWPFINKMDRYLQTLLKWVSASSRSGANPWRIVNQIRSKLRIPAAAVQVPIGIEDEFKGVIDLVHWRSVYNEGQKGNEVVISQEIPESVMELAKAKRNELVEQLAEVDEEIGELFPNDELFNNHQIAAAIRRSTIALKFSPVFLGFAIKNTAVQPSLTVCALTFPIPLNPRCSRTIRVYPPLRLRFN